MKSKLVIAPIERLQSKIVSTLHSNKGIGIYVSLNKNSVTTKEILIKKKINIKNIFFIDCVSSGKVEKDVIQIPTTQLNNLRYALESFISNIKGKKFLIIDALSVLLIYNNENKVAQFIQKINEYAVKKDVEIIAFSPKTKEKTLLNKIFGFFDEVIGK